MAHPLKLMKQKDYNAAAISEPGFAFLFSCVIVSSKNTYDLNEWFNIKNPHGFETLEMAFSMILSSLIACLNTPIFCIILDLRSTDQTVYEKITLNREQLRDKTHNEIIALLKKQTLKQLSTQ